MKKSFLIIAVSLMAIPSVSFSQLILTENKSNGLQLKIYISASGDKMKTKSRTSAAAATKVYQSYSDGSANSNDPKYQEMKRQERIKGLKTKEIPGQQSSIARFEESHDIRALSKSEKEQLAQENKKLKDLQNELAQLEAGGQTEEIKKMQADAAKPKEQKTRTRPLPRR